MIIELKFQHTYKIFLLNLHIRFFLICYFRSGGGSCCSIIAFKLSMNKMLTNFLETSIPRAQVLGCR